MKKISSQRVIDAVSLLQKGFSYNFVASRLSLSKTTIHRIKKKHLPDVKNVLPGRPPLLSVQQTRSIVRKITSGQLDTAVDAQKSLREQDFVQVSAQTVRRVLKKSGMKSAVKRKKPLLSRKHKKARFEFATKYQNWTVEDWKNVIWSDETKVNRLGSDGRKWGWKHQGDQLKFNHVLPTLKYGGGSIMIWGCMVSEGPGFLAKIDGGLDAELYCRILSEELQNTIDWYSMDRNKIIFQHDNDPKHTAKKTKEWIQQNGIQVLDWPAQSPDLNPIEMLWINLKRRLANYEEISKGVQELWERVEVEWDKIPKEDCLNLIESMPKRIAEVLKAKGGYTIY